MKEYYKEKLKIDFDSFKLYITIIVVLLGGLATLILKDNFGDRTVDIVLLYIGVLFLIGLVTICIRTHSKVNKDLNKLKNN